jgi:hypothetical protein
MNNKSVIDEAIEQMQQKMADSRGNRTGDYRIGLDAAINILENLRDMHKDEICTAFRIGDKFSVDYYLESELDTDEQYYNETFNSKQDAKG